MTDGERFAKWRYAFGLLAAFLIGWQFAPEFAATNWYRPVTTILVVLLLLGCWFVSREDDQRSSAMPENEERTIAGYIDRISRKFSKNRS